MVPVIRFMARVTIENTRAMLRGKAVKPRMGGTVVVKVVLCAESVSSFRFKRTRTAMKTGSVSEHRTKRGKLVGTIRSFDAGQFLYGELR